MEKDKEKYKIYYYEDSRKKKPVMEYINNLSIKEQAKVFAYLELLGDKGGHLDEPYSKHIFGKIRELRVDFARNRHRIFYFAFIDRKIILLHAFLKKTAKAPQNEINIAVNNYRSLINNKQAPKWLN